MLNFKIFDEVLKYYKNTIKALLFKYKLFDFENDVNTKLWILTKDINFNKFNTQKGIDNFIFISLKNFCKTLYIKRYQYNERNVLCLDTDTFDKGTLKYDDLNFSNIIFKDMQSYLTPKEAQIIEYKFKNNLSTAEIATLLGKSRQGVHKSIKRSLLKIKVNI